MKENEMISFETSPEHVPSPEEIFSIFKELTEKEITEVRRLEDEKGLYLLEVTTPGDLEEEKIEYGYMRKGRFKEGQCSSTSIHATYYKDNIPYYGTNVAEYSDRNWKIV